jgi:hypothetical protein
MPNGHAIYCRDLACRSTGSLTGEPGWSAAFPSANVPANATLFAEVLASCHTSDERKDACAIATAIAASAQITVTDNVNDFVAVVSRPALAVRTLTPDACCNELFHWDPARFVAAARRHRTSMTHPAFDPDGYLNLLAGNCLGLPRTAELLRPHRHAL